MSIDLKTLAERLDLELRGDAGVEISGVASLPSAGSGDLCFIQDRKYLEQLAVSRCAAVILPAELAAEAGDRPALLAADPYYSFVCAIDLVRPAAPVPASIHASAQVATDARIGRGVTIGPLAVIGNGAAIGDGSTIGAAAVVADEASIGRNCRIHGRVTLGRAVRIGERCEIHSGAVIGADGFGLLMHDGAWIKIPHLGSVDVGDDVEIGANTTVDRGALDDTVIEQGCKLDNQIQVAHNVRIGAHTAIAACVGIAGSATIGRYCKIAGAAVVLGHLSVADHVTITAMSLVTRDIVKAGVYSSGTPLLENRLWHRNNARYKTLDELARSVARLKKGKR